MRDCTLCACSFNTPLVTETMLKSWFYWHPEPMPVSIIENSTLPDTAKLLDSYGIPYVRNPGGRHELTVDMALANVKTRYALLVDTDIVFIANQASTFESFKQAGHVLQGEVCGARGGMALFTRVHPWHCWIDVEQLRNAAISFHCRYRSTHWFKDGCYDVGASMYEDCIKAGLTVGDSNKQGEEYLHYEGMSWRVQGYNQTPEPIGNNAHNNEALYQYGLQVDALYFQVNKEPHKYSTVDLSLYFK